MSKSIDLSLAAALAIFSMSICGAALSASPAPEYHRAPYAELEPASGELPIVYDAGKGGFAGQTDVTAVTAPKGATYFKLQIEMESATAGPLAATFDDFGSHALLQKLTLASRKTGETFLSAPFYAAKVRVTVSGAAKLKFSMLVPRLDANRVTAHAVTLHLLSLDMLPADESMRSLRRAVAKLHIGSAGAVCTGFLVSQNAMLTAYHCLEDSSAFKATASAAQPRCNDILAQFDYEAIDRPGPMPLAACQAVLAFGSYPHKAGDPNAGDFALLKFDPADLALPESGAARPHLSVLRQLPAGKSFYVKMMQHPWGWPIAFDSRCTAEPTADPKILDYDCTTMPGSSGSAVLDDKGEVVAIHNTSHSGDLQQLLCLDAGTCVGADRPAAFNWRNYGTPIGAIWAKIAPFL